MADVSNCIAIIEDAEKATLSIIDIVKTKSYSIGQLPKVFDLLKDFGDCAKHLGDVWPEIKDVDAQEAGQIASRLYETGKKIYEACTGNSVAAIAAAAQAQSQEQGQVQEQSQGQGAGQEAQAQPSQSPVPEGAK